MSVIRFRLADQFRIIGSVWREPKPRKLFPALRYRAIATKKLKCYKKKAPDATPEQLKLEQSQGTSLRALGKKYEISHEEVRLRILRAR
jgi:hypothetical protein